MKVVLERYHGLGNDYVVFDPNKNELELTAENVKMICDRNAGLGADGVLVSINEVTRVYALNQEDSNELDDLVKRLVHNHS